MQHGTLEDATANTRRRRSAPGITVRHTRKCRTRSGGTCNCAPSFEAFVWSKRDEKKVRRTFPTITAAKAWRADALGEMRRGKLSSTTTKTLRDAWLEWIAGAEAGTNRTRSGSEFKPSALRSYRSAMTTHVLDDLGAARLSEIRRRDLQDLVDRLVERHLDASTIRNTLLPVRSIYRRALLRDEVVVNPTVGLELPKIDGVRDRFATPAAAAAMLLALPEDLRPLWATAFYGGLRRGELLALRAADADLDRGVIHVERSWDPEHGGFVAPKSQRAVRTVPIPTALLGILREHLLRSGRRGNDLLFGATPTRPLTPSWVRRRSRDAWDAENAKRRERDEPELPVLGLHEARHTFASLMIAAGVNGKALSTYLGHSSVSLTLDRYGHLFPGNENEAAALLDAFLARADTVH